MKFVGFAIVLVVVAQASAGQQIEPTTAARVGMVKLKHDGVFVGYQNGLGSKPSQAYEFAVAVKGTATHVNSVLGQLEDEVRSALMQTRDRAHALKRQEMRRDLEVLATWSDDVAPLRGLAVEFSSDLTSMAVDVRSLLAVIDGFECRIKRLVDRIGRFPDVSADHWAAGTLLELRRAGIVEGYMDEGFGQ